MSAILKVQPLKNVVLSPTDDAINYEVLVVVEPGPDWKSRALMKDGRYQVIEITGELKDGFESEEGITEMVVVFGVSNEEDAESLFFSTVRDYAITWIAIGGPIKLGFTRLSLLWALQGLGDWLDQAPSVAVVGGVLEDNVLLVANVIAEAFPETVITVLTPLCLTASDYAFDAPDAVAMMTEDDDDLSDEDDYDLSDDQE